MDAKDLLMFVDKDVCVMPREKKAPHPMLLTPNCVISLCVMVRDPHSHWC